MNVVTCYKASQVAGVSKQAIQSLKNANTLQKGKYTFFCYDSETGKFGVDLDNKHWLNYLDRNKDNPKKKKRLIKIHKSKDKSPENSQSFNQNKLIDSVVKAIKDSFEIDEKELTELLELIEKYYEEG